MAHQFNEAARKKLNSEERVRSLAPAQTLERLGFQAGRAMADIGCGTGVFSLSAAGLADTTVYAVDISQVMLDDVLAAAEQAGLDNIIAVQSKEYDLVLADETADFVLLCTVFHEIEEQERFLKEALRICREDGTIAIIEFNENFTGFGPPLSHRLPRSRVQGVLTRVGLLDSAVVDISEGFYAVKATKSTK